MNNGYTMIEMVVVILLIGILSVLSLPRFEKRIELEELKSEKDFTYKLWEELELHAAIQRELTDEDKWPDHPLSVLGRTRGVIVTYDLGIPDQDNEWQFDGVNLYHRRMNNEIWYFTYNSTNFHLSEFPVKL